ncbi:uncharacterized protein STEHIDRAFT_112299 [Stereum hirsutum FP-91666 SS1]|uniref:uncharacterized protein n=1 Tax=Stereum hirsutum (strain FP-91666) TaxID=721885 RepID=UPI000444978F|nr:uncharacterized protein STEHIDRAFT_112299 [Stereum hirsutum FP-91666 SS1]EIM84725.1 hypothetical protein STEHIDRAFT_112299 [Stereum hirsutum FP-91666 SS1]
MPPSPVDPSVELFASLESPLASSTLSPKSSSDNTGIPPTQFPRHERFWFRDGSVIFVVKNTSYRLHLYLFELHSTKFAKTFLLDHTDINEPIVLEGIDEEDFDAFLNVLYRISYTSNPSQSAKAWASVLHLASIWEFPSIRQLAIESFEPSATDVDKVVLGHKYGHHEWLLPGYSGLVAREEPLTIEEGTRLGVRDVVDINNAREKIRALSTLLSKIEMT